MCLSVCLSYLDVYYLNILFQMQMFEQETSETENWIMIIVMT